MALLFTQGLQIISEFVAPHERLDSAFLVLDPQMQNERGAAVIHFTCHIYRLCLFHMLVLNQGRFLRHTPGQRSNSLLWFMNELLNDAAICEDQPTDINKGVKI